MNKYTLFQGLIAILIMSGITFFTRAVPFVSFFWEKQKAE